MAVVFGIPGDRRFAPESREDLIALGNFLWERNFLVTADGLEELSNFPDELTVITN
jgi:hypothetical protein